MYASTKVALRHIFPFPLLAAILLAGTALRFYRIDYQSVWYDEVFALSISRLPFEQMNAALIQDVVHPPLHYYLLHWWFVVFGFGPFQARVLSLVFGVVGLWMLYIFARYLFDSATALVATLILAVSQLAVIYSQEARPYAQFQLIFLCCAYLFLRAAREKRLSLWMGFLLFAGLLVYTHYYGFFVLLTLSLYCILDRRRFPIPRTWLLGGMIFVVAAYTPWLAGGVVHEALYGQRYHLAKATVASSPPQATGAPADHWYTPLTILNTFNNGRPNGVLDAAPWWTFVIGGILFSLPAGATLWCLVRHQHEESDIQIERNNIVYLTLLTVTPVVLALAVSELRGAYNIRYIAFCAAPYYVLVARGLFSIRSLALRCILIASMLLYSTNALQANYFVPYKEDYKHSLSWIADDYHPGDCSAVAQFWERRQAKWAWSIYEEGRPGPEIRPLDAILATPENCERVWLISVFYRGNPVAVRAAELARKNLQETYRQGAKRRFFWVDIDLYMKKERKPG